MVPNIVIKRDGSKQEYNKQKIMDYIKLSTDGLNNVDPDELYKDLLPQISDGMNTSDIQSILTVTASEKIDVDCPDWTFVAARLFLFDLYHKVSETGRYYDIKEYISKYVNEGKLHPTLLDGFDFDRINAAIVPNRDFLFNYLGIKTLHDRYLLKDKSGKVVELPQHMFMCIAMFLASKEKPEEKTDWAIKFYDVLSKFEAMVATPTLANARTTRNQLSSCYVGSIDDSLEGIMDSYKNMSIISKLGGGIGYDVSHIRSLGSTIDGYEGKAGGLIPFMKIANDVAVAFDQLGVRKGAIAVYLEIWHKDVMEFLELRKNSGEERRRAHDLFTALWINDLFMERVKNDEDWSLFDPQNVRDLLECYGKEFEDKYIRYENDPTINKVTIKAKNLWKEVLRQYFETGMPFLGFKDTANTANPNSHRGIIRSSNLCVTGDTRILTKEYGNAYIGTLVENGVKEVTCWNGEEWSTTSIFKTSGCQATQAVKLSNNVEINATPYHKWLVLDNDKEVIVETKDLKPGMELVPCKKLPTMDIVDKKVHEAFKKLEQTINTYGKLTDYDAISKTNAIMVVGRYNLNTATDLYLSLNSFGVNCTIIKAQYFSSPYSNSIFNQTDSDVCDIEHYLFKKKPVKTYHYIIYIPPSGCNKLLEYGYEPTRFNLDKQDDNEENFPTTSVVSVDQNYIYAATYCGNEPKKHRMVFNGVITGNCTEIYQNTKPTSYGNHEVEINNNITFKNKRSYNNGEIAVCNLASINIARTNTIEDINRVVPIVTRMLDNVIDLNLYPVIESAQTNQDYRSIGCGILGEAEYMASKQIMYGSKEHYNEINKIMSMISYNVINASADLAKEKGSYKWFDGSKWSMGKLPMDYAREEVLELTDELPKDEMDKWNTLRDKVKQGMRNGYLMSIAPTSSISILMGTTASIEACYKKKWYEENLTGQITVTVPNLNLDTFEYYVSAYDVDQVNCVELAAIRQKWIDQGQSLNIFVKLENSSGKYLNSIYTRAWELGVKSTYYLRSQSPEVDESVSNSQFECTSCQ